MAVQVNLAMISLFSGKTSKLLSLSASHARMILNLSFQKLIPSVGLTFNISKLDPSPHLPEAPEHLELCTFLGLVAKVEK